MDVFDLFAKLSLDSSEYDKGLESAEKSGSNFSDKLKKGIAVAAGVATAAITATKAAAVATSAAFINAAKNTASYGDNVDKSSQKMQFAAKSWQEWDYVLNIAGSSMNSMTMGMKTLTNQIDQAKNGSKSATANFKALGISTKDLKNLSKEEIFEKAIAGFQKMGDTTDRAALANKVFGRSGQELAPLFNMTNEETQKLIKTANEYGMVMSDDAVKASATFQDSLTTMQKTLTGLKNTMMAEFLPSLSTIMDGLSAVFAGKNTDEGMKKIWYGVSTLVENLTKVLPKFIEIGKTILLSVLQSFAPMLPQLVSTIFDLGVQAITTVASMIPQMMPVIITGIQNATTALLQALPVTVSGLTQLIVSIAQWLSEGNNTAIIVNGIVQLCTQIVSSIGMILPVLIPAIVIIISEVAKALTSEENIMLLLDAILTVIGALAVGIAKAAPVLVKAVLGIIQNLANLVSKFFEWAVPIAAKGIEGIVNMVKTWGSNIGSFISTFFTNTISNIGSFIVNAINKFKELPAKTVSIGSDVVKGLWNGISNMSKWIADKIKGFGEGVVNGLKKFFKISSPSKLFRDEIGTFLAMGIGEGFEQTMPKTIADMTDSMADATAQLNSEITPAITATSAGQAGSVFNAGGFTVNVYGAEGQDVRALAKAVSEEIQNMINDRGQVYA